MFRLFDRRDRTFAGRHAERLSRGLVPTGDANATQAREDEQPLTAADIIAALQQIPPDAILRPTSNDAHYVKISPFRMLREAVEGDLAYVEAAGNRVEDEGAPLRFMLSFW